MKTDFETIEIIEDGEEDIEQDISCKSCKSNKKTHKKKQENDLLKSYYDDPLIYEIGVDEAGRGPLFGRVYTAAVILPKGNDFGHSKMKDSKKFSSKKKIEEVADYIKENAVAWSVTFEDEKTIDNINILQATQQSMHHSIIETKKRAIQKMKETESKGDDKKDYTFHLLIDGNYFNPLSSLNLKTNKLETMPYHCIEGGDNKYTSIAAASILAKVARDKYIEDLCALHPELSDKYSIDSNKGYGSKKHLDGIKEHGITVWHRKTFGICKKYAAYKLI
jgi:ribonuclease HII